MRSHLTRRELLAAGGAAALAAVPGSALGTATASSWPTFAGDAANTGRNPDIVGPSAADVGVRWGFETGARNSSSPTVVDGTVYAGSWDQTIYALNVDDGTRLWRYGTEGRVTSSPAVVDGTVYVGSEDNNLYALDANEGDLQWRFGTGDSIIGSPTVLDGVVYVGSQDGTLYAVDAADGETTVWTFDADAAITTTPAVTDERVYVGSDDQHIYALNRADGSELWSFQTGGLVRSSPAVADGTVYVGSNDNNLYALDAESGDDLFAFETERSVIASPAIGSGRVYVTSRDGRIYGIGRESGDEIWSFNTGQAITSSPALTDEMLYFGGENGFIYGLHSVSGDPAFTVETARRIRSSPAVTEETVYIGSLDQHLYALSEGAAGSDPGGPVGEPTPTPEEDDSGLGFLLFPFAVAGGVATLLGVLYGAKRLGLFPTFDPDEIDAPDVDDMQIPVWDVVLRDVISRADAADRTATENLIVTKYVDPATMEAPIVAYEVESVRDEPARVTLSEPTTDLTEDDLGFLPGDGSEWELRDGRLVYEGVVAPNETLRTMVGRQDVNPENAESLRSQPTITAESVEKAGDDITDE
jgi:outer membrane protein assembly factor BamB